MKVKDADIPFKSPDYQPGAVHGPDKPAADTKKLKKVTLESSRFTVHFRRASVDAR